MSLKYKILETKLFEKRRDREYLIESINKLKLLEIIEIDLNLFIIVFIS